MRAILRQLLKFPMRWSSGADRDQPWLARSLPVDCRATDGTHRWGGHYEALTVGRPRKHEAMHCNVFKKNSGMVDEALGFVDITCSDLARLSEWTPAQFQNHVGLVLEERRRRARGEISQGHLNDVIKAAGFAPTDEGLLADPDLLMGGALLRLSLIHI